MGWNGSGQKGAAPAQPKVTAKKPSPVRGIVAGLVIVLAAGAYFMFFSSAEIPREGKGERTAKKIPAAKPVKTAVQKSVPTRPSVVSESLAEKRMTTPATNPEEGPSDLASPEETAVKPKRKPIFKNGTDQLIFLAVFASNGASIPPLPRMSSADTQRYIDSLRSPIEIEADDPPQVVEMKKNVNEVRQQIADIIVKEPDRELSEILNAHREDFNNRINLRADAQKAYDKFVEEGDVEGAAAYLEKANKFLEDYGVEPIGQEPDEDDYQN